MTRDRNRENATIEWGTPLTARPWKDVGLNGLEIAIDATKGPGFHTTGAIYDLVATEVNAMKPDGESNHIQVTCDRNLIEVQVNGGRSQPGATEVDLDDPSHADRFPQGSCHHPPRSSFCHLPNQIQRTCRQDR